MKRVILLLLLLTATSAWAVQITTQPPPDATDGSSAISGTTGTFSGAVEATGGFTGTVNTAAQGSITSLGTLTGLTVANGGDIAEFQTTAGNRELLLKGTYASATGTIVAIRWLALDSGSNNTAFAQIGANVSENTHPNEDAYIFMHTTENGTMIERLRLNEGGALSLLTGGFVPDFVTSDPCPDTVSYPEGAIFYNDTNDIPCYCNGAGADISIIDGAACFP